MRYGIDLQSSFSRNMAIRPHYTNPNAAVYRIIAEVSPLAQIEKANTENNFRKLSCTCKPRKTGAIGRKPQDS
jgi:hypothetical protein